MTRNTSIPAPPALLVSAALMGPMIACGADHESDASDASTTADPAPTTGPADPARMAVDEAREQFPTYLALHTEVIARTCTPNTGVCHNIKEYPDLHTPQTMLGAIDQPCNLAEADPLTIYSGCERAGDRIALLGASNPEFVSEVGYITRELDPVTAETTALVVHVRDPIPGAMLDPAMREGIRVSRATKQGIFAVGELVGRVSYERGASALKIADYATLTREERALVETEMALGDPNQDGVFGGTADPFKMIVPGDPARSYLLQRLQGNVPGSPMPLANEPLRAAAILALACWIEGITDPERIAVDAAIDYDDCRTAAAFGGADPDSGHSLRKNVQPIFDQFCAAPGCHGDDHPAADLALTLGRSRAALLADSTQVSGTPRVEPGNPTRSYLITKLTGNGQLVGRVMPLTPTGESGVLEGPHIATIRAWIVAGAPED